MLRRTTPALCPLRPVNTLPHPIRQELFSLSLQGYRGAARYLGRRPETSKWRRGYECPLRYVLQQCPLCVKILLLLQFVLRGKFPIGSNREKSPGRKLLLMVSSRLFIFKGHRTYLGANHDRNAQLTPGVIRNNCVVSVSLPVRKTSALKPRIKTQPN